MTPRATVIAGGFLGLSAGVFPELAVAGLAALGIFAAIKRKVLLGHWIWAFIILGCVRGILYWRVQNTPWIGFLEAILCYLLYCGAFWLKPLQQLVFRRVFLIGGFVTASWVLVSLFPGWVTLAPWILNADQKIQATLEQTNGIDNLIPTSPENAFVLRSFGQQGSGRVRLTLEMRSAQPVQLRIALLHKDLPAVPVGKSTICNIDNNWKTCSIDVSLKTRGDLNLLIGGYYTWKAESGILSIRHYHLEVLSFPTLTEWVSTLPRVQGWTFNANAFAAWMTLVVLVTVVSSRVLWEWCLLVPVFLAILLSGSRGAMGVSLIGMFCGLWLILPARYKILLYCALGALIFGFILVNNLDTPLRALRILTEDGSNVSRLEVYQLSFRAFLESPVIGVGDLSRKMQSYANDSSPTLTHAHNLFLQIIGESGLSGLFIFIFLWIIGIMSRFKNRDTLGLMLITCIFLLNQSDYLYWYAPVQALLWIGFSGFRTDQPNSASLGARVSPSS
jgi:O-Antigen ligase